MLLVLVTEQLWLQLYYIQLQISGVIICILRCCSCPVVVAERVFKVCLIALVSVFQSVHKEVFRLLKKAKKQPLKPEEIRSPSLVPLKVMMEVIMMLKVVVILMTVVIIVVVMAIL